ncbi:aspartate aminotransferase family protein [Paraburkholderia silvatlantica]|uniref:Diaminobutyrate--2-oxoglutarate transaminase n=1 Tax=Paraburkholderia silvatlantica TaxID=321895 RepID=A0A2V4TRZ0_9BURK|nr:aspartate aminotransferase family protein [Paraburkholderia silvatlantica]PYE21304.1 ornithine--oxo-acid transaminase [Paraburkholderia silvatlantica]TDQ86555.1 ornithine--oxo-acid transaminase [Paraburkholderia silvatlantica]
MEDQAADAAIYERFVNPAWSNIVRSTGLDMKPVRASGSWLYMEDGRKILDFVTGYGAMPLGHNPFALLERFSSDLQTLLPNLNPLGISADAGELAKKLIELAGIVDGKVYFGNGGVDAVEAALKFAMVHTGRTGIVTIEGGFHGLSLTATWLAGSDFWRRDLPAPPAQFKQSPLGDTDSIGSLLANNDVAAVLLEPVQGTAGARVWKQCDLMKVADLCAKHGTVLIFDEILCGIARTGHWFAYQTLDVPAPQIVLISKALTGGIFPVSAVLMQDAIYRSVFARDSAAKIHGATFSGNRLGMRCGSHVLSLLHELDICSNVQIRGEYLKFGIDRLGSKLGFSCEGIGLARSIHATPECVHRFGDDVAVQLWHALLTRNVLTIPAAHDLTSVRLLPPLNVTADEVDLFLRIFDDVLQDLFSEEGAA